MRWPSARSTIASANGPNGLSCHQPDDDPHPARRAHPGDPPPKPLTRSHRPILPTRVRTWQRRPPAGPHGARALTRGPTRLRPRLGGDRLVRHGARAAAPALPHRPARRGGRRRGSRRLPAQGMGRHPQPGRGTDQRPLDQPRRPPPPVPHPVGRPARARVRAAVRRPDAPRRRSPTTWVVVLFLACATAYAFFQVPYVAMPAEMTDDYDERTRLMTWRVAILALAILVSGGLSPVIRNALGPEWGYRGVGLFVGTLILLGTVGAWWGTRSTPHDATPRPPAAAFATSCSVVAASREFRTLLTVFVLQALATGRCSPASTTSRGCCSARGRLDDPVRLLRRPGPARDPAVAARRRGARQAHRLRLGLAAPRRRGARDAAHRAGRGRRHRG